MRRTGRTDQDQTAIEHARRRTQCKWLVAGLSRDGAEATRGKKQKSKLKRRRSQKPGTTAGAARLGRLALTERDHRVNRLQQRRTKWK